MISQDQWKRRLLIVEIVSLLTLIASLFLLRHQAPQQPDSAAYWLALPALASLTMFLSFLGLMYLRWVKSAAKGARQTVQSALFAFFALTLLGTWAFAIIQTWQSLNSSMN